MVDVLHTSKLFFNRVNNFEFREIALIQLFKILNSGGKLQNRLSNISNT